MPLTTALYVGLAALVHLLLTTNVSRLRWKHRAPSGYGPSGDGEIKELRRAARAHGNFAENAPLLLIMLAALEAGGGGSTEIHVFGAIILLSRVGHAFALLNGGPFPLRALSVLATWGLYLVGGLLLVARSL